MGNSMDGSVAQRLVDLLTASDIELVAGVVRRDAADAPQWIVDALLQPSVRDALFDRPEVALSLASPALVFTVAVHGVAHQLSVGTSTTEWLGPRTRLPVFDVPRM